jgi:hypothetical protein
MLLRSRHNAINSLRASIGARRFGLGRRPTDRRARRLDAARTPADHVVADQPRAGADERPRPQKPTNTHSAIDRPLGTPAARVAAAVHSTGMPRQS